MAAEWPAVPLTDVFDIGSGLSKPRSEFGFGHGFLTFKDVLDNYFVPESLNALVNSTEKERSSCSIRRGDVFLTRTSETQPDLGMSCVALKDYESATFNGFTKRLRPKPGTEIVPEYAAYYFRGPRFRRDVTAMSSLSTRASLNNEMLGRLSIVLPPVKVQAAIGRILKSLDDKIELNRRMNETLEGMARAIFKSWFVDFDPVRAKAAGCQPVSMDADTAAFFPDRFVDSPLGSIPKGWKVGSLLDHACLLSGGTPKTDELDYWGGTVPWASAKDVSQCRKTFLISTERTITKRGLENSSTQIIDANSTVVVARGATTGRMAMFGLPISMNQTCYALRSKQGSHFFLYCQARYVIGDLVHSAHGSVFDTITIRTFETTPVLVPDPETTRAFDGIMQPLFLQILARQRETVALASVRDILLPKLLSGEICPSNVPGTVCGR